MKNKYNKISDQHLMSSDGLILQNRNGGRIYFFFIHFTSLILSKLKITLNTLNYLQKFFKNVF